MKTTPFAALFEASQHTIRITYSHDSQVDVDSQASARTAETWNENDRDIHDYYLPM